MQQAVIFDLINEIYLNQIIIHSIYTKHVKVQIMVFVDDFMHVFYNFLLKCEFFCFAKILLCFEISILCYRKWTWKTWSIGSGMVLCFAMKFEQTHLFMQSSNIVE